MINFKIRISHSFLIRQRFSGYICSSAIEAILKNRSLIHFNGEFIIKDMIIISQKKAELIAYFEIQFVAIKFIV